MKRFDWMKTLCAFCLTLITCLPALAQDEAPRVEIFGGYSHNIGDAQGWNASVAINANRWFGVVADFSGLTSKTREQDFEEKIRANTYLFGPQFSYRGNKRVTPFARVLFGASNLNAKATELGQSAEFSDTNFSYGLGGGLDIRVSKRIAIRAVQADYIHTRSFGEGQHNGRLSFGVVFRLGGS
jgi:opacity protein-like surface antigen